MDLSYVILVVILLFILLYVLYTVSMNGNGNYSKIAVIPGIHYNICCDDCEYNRDGCFA